MFAHRLSLSTQQIAKDPAPYGLSKGGHLQRRVYLAVVRTACAAPSCICSTLTQQKMRIY